VNQPLRPAGEGVWRQAPGSLTCGACGHTADALGLTMARPADRSGPADGDYSICIRCGEVTVIELHPLLGARLRPATPVELLEFSTDPAMIEAVHRIHRHRFDGPAS
jgi:hypothetical protein